MEDTDGGIVIVALNDSLDNELNKSGKSNKPYAEIGLDGGEIYTGVLDSPIADDWSPILRSFGLDPDEFMDVNDKVRMFKWQQSRTREDGVETIW